MTFNSLPAYLSYPSDRYAIQLTYSPESVSLLPSDLIENEKYMLQLISENHNILRHLPEKYKTDQEFINKAIDTLLSPDKKIFFMMSDILDSVPSFMWDNEEFILKIIKINEFSDYFQYASDRVKEDKDFIRQVVSIDLNLIIHASYKILSDEEFILESIYHSTHHKKYKTDQNANQTCETTIEKIVPYLPKSLFDSKNFISTLSKNKNFTALRYASEEIKCDEKIVFKAISYNPFNWEFVGIDLMNNRKFIYRLINKFPYSYFIEKDPFISSAVEELKMLGIRNEIIRISVRKKVPNDIIDLIFIFIYKMYT